MACIGGKKSMCIICEQGKHLATLHQILLGLEADNCDDLEIYQYVKRKYNELKEIIDEEEAVLQRAKDVLEGLLVETAFYPVIDDKKQAEKN